MGWSVNSYYTGVFTEANVLGCQFPGTIRSWDDAASLIYTYKINDANRAIFKDYGLQQLAVYGAGGQRLWGKKPVRNIADFKGMKIRAFGLYSDLFMGLGASTVFIPHEESYMGLQLGTVDAYSTAFYIWQDYKHYEVCPYVMEPSHQLVLLASDVIANMKAFNSLPDDLKAILIQASEELIWRGLYLEASELDYYKRIAEVRKLGYKGSSACEVVLEEVVVSSDNLVGGAEGLDRGWQLMLKTLDTERLEVAACGVGVAEGALGEAMAYAKSRVQFGQPIGKLQAIRHMLVDMAVEVRAARLLTYEAASLAEQDKPEH